MSDYGERERRAMEHAAGVSDVPGEWNMRYREGLAAEGLTLVDILFVTPDHRCRWNLAPLPYGTLFGWPDNTLIVDMRG